MLREKCHQGAIILLSDPDKRNTYELTQTQYAGTRWGRAVTEECIWEHVTKEE